MNSPIGGGRYDIASHNRSLGRMRTIRALRRHQALLDEAVERQLDRRGNERDNGKVIEREIKAVKRLRARLYPSLS